MGFARRTFMVAFPQARNMAGLKVLLEKHCPERQGKTLRGRDAAMGVHLQADHGLSGLAGGPL